jgi:hypothetical protein
MEKLEAIMKSGSDAYDSEISKLKLSIDLHQSMLVSLDDQTEISSLDNMDIEARKELANIETVVALTDQRVKKIFGPKMPKANPIIRTERKIEIQKVEVKAIVDTKPPVAQRKTVETVAAQLFKELPEEQPISMPMPNEPEAVEYIRKDGFVNNQYIADKLADHISRCGELNFKEMVEWVELNFPAVQDKWVTVRKGTQNILSALKRANRVVQAGNYGSYKEA